MRKITFVLVFILLSWTSIYSQKRVLSNEITISETKVRELQKKFEDYQLIEIDLKQFKSDISSLKETRFLWSVDEKTTYDMKIYPKDIRGPSYQEVIVSENGTTSIKEKRPVVTYKGHLSDENNVRLTIDDDFIYGSIETKDGLMMIDQLKYVLKDKSMPSNKLVMYKGVKGDGSVCGTPDTPAKSISIEGNVAKSTSAGCNIIEINSDCDTEYWNDYNDDSFNRMLGEYNMVQDVYEDDLDAVLSVSSLHVFIGGTYTSSDSNTIINEIKSLWSSSPYIL